MVVQNTPDTTEDTYLLIFTPNSNTLEHYTIIVTIIQEWVE